MKKDIIIGYYNKSVILTYLGIIFAISGIVNIMQGYVVTTDNIDRISISMILFVLSGICDLFDGVIARRCKRTEKEKKFGIQIDSLADVVSFLVFPIVLLSKLAYGHKLLPLMSYVYVILGIIRLAYFNITTEENKGFYRGLPVTYSALIIPVVYVVTKFINLQNISNIIIIVYSIISILFILNFKIKKPKGIWYIIFPIVAILTIIGCCI